jgi:hypothetical protein
VIGYRNSANIPAGEVEAFRESLKAAGFAEGREHRTDPDRDNAIGLKRQQLISKRGLPIDVALVTRTSILEFWPSM